MIKKIRNFAFISLLLFSVSSCSLFDSTETRFYSLSAQAGEAKHKRPTLKIGVGPVEIPRLLQRPQLVERINQYEIRLLEDHQWAGALREDLVSVIVENLSSLVGTNQVEGYPWKHEFKPAYRVRIDIEQLDGTPGLEVQLKARWQLIRHRQVVRTEYENIKIPLSQLDVTSYVAAQSRAIGQLTEHIAKHIR